MSTTVGKRKNINHFDEMPQKDFVAFMREAEKGDGKVMVDINMKLDGCLASFGMDVDGRIWLKSGKSDKIYTVGDFTTYTRKKYNGQFWHSSKAEEKEQIFRRAQGYDNLLDRLQTTEVGLTPGTYLVGEMFNTYMATHKFGTCKSRSKFVNLWYDSDQFKVDCVFYVYETNIAQTIDSRRFAFRDPKIFSGDVEINSFNMGVWDGFRDNLSKQSLSEFYKWIARNMKRDIAEDIFKQPIINERAHQLGACEGIVVSRIHDTSKKQFKIITPSFREMVKKS